ncbi:hypothetical protein PBAL39_13607 [Pedobacter sp. BAL39]|nr:hypothetical protein PBAL39_13607 [Pedobacter sp. BAL39]
MASFAIGECVGLVGFYRWKYQAISTVFFALSWDVYDVLPLFFCSVRGFFGSFSGVKSLVDSIVLIFLISWFLAANTRS